MDENDSAAPSRKTTLGDLGATLPVGGVSREMVAKPWRMKEEREIGALRERMKKATMGDFIAAVIGTMFVRLGDIDFEKVTKDEERVLRVCKMPLGDVFYAYAWLRAQAMGPSIDIVVKCPDCGTDSKIKAQLTDLDVTTAALDHTWTYELSVPVMIRGAVAKVLTLGHSSWEPMRRVTGRANIGQAKAEILRSSLRQIDDRKPFPVLVEDFDELPKIDVEGLAACIDENEAGPDFAVEARCTNCQALVRTSLDWGFDAFFSRRSSR